MKLLDCTLRDGGYYTNWDFDTQMVRDLITSLDLSKVDIIELGYKSPVKGGKYRKCNDRFIWEVLDYRKPVNLQLAFMIDAKEGLQKQDLSIFSVIEKNKKGVVLLVNKWDSIEKETITTKEHEEDIISKIAPFTDLPILFVSALNKQRIHKALEIAMEVFENRKKRIPTSKLNDTMLGIIKHNPPPSNKGKFVKVKYCMQLPTPTPQFVFFSNLPQYVKEPYKRFLENKMREIFNFNGVPIVIYFRQK